MSPTNKAAADPDLRLPHERDQSTDQTAAKPDPRIQQARRDLERGQVDTDMRTPPGLDAEQRRQYVPGAGGRHPSDGGPVAPRESPPAGGPGKSPDKNR